MLRRRAELLKTLRRFFDDRGFLEVETPTLSHDTVIDEHLDPLSVVLFDDARQRLSGQTLFLQTSPEFGMKRLLAAGATAIYQITRAYRGGEIGQLHNPEFTMLEWYRVGDDYAAGRKLLGDLAAATLGRGEPEQLTYREAFLQFAAVDPITADVAQLAAVLRPGSVAPGNNADRAYLLDRVLVEHVEPKLGQRRPMILYDYPADQAALAKVRPADSAGSPAAAERFELYCQGIELANGYHELLDPQILSERNQTNNERRRAAGKYSLPETSRLLTAMQQNLPACSGCALGVDRLLMVAAGMQSIHEVIAFPVDRA